MQAHADSTFANSTTATEPTARAELNVSGHMPALDGVRGLAVLMVLGFHFISAATPVNIAEKAVVRLASYGANGVELFFVLSGFLITGILYDARHKPNYFRNFYMRRALRIFPLYYGVLVLVFFVAPLIPLFQGAELDYLLDRQAWAWLYAINLYIAKEGTWSFSYLQHFWSLAVEEHFYLFWPFVVYALVHRPKTLLAVSFAIAVAAMLSRLAGTQLGGPLSGDSPASTPAQSPPATAPATPGSAEADPATATEPPAQDLPDLLQ